MFIIKDCSEKDIQPGDFVECLGHELPYDPTDGWEYEVVGLDVDAQMLLCELPDGQSYVSANLVDYVWRKV